jgi:hypothetical protein
MAYCLPELVSSLLRYGHKGPEMVALKSLFHLNDPKPTIQREMMLMMRWRNWRPIGFLGLCQKCGMMH